MPTLLATSAVPHARTWKLALSVLVGTLSSAGCSGDQPSGGATESTAAEIVNGAPATAFPEAATLDIDMGPNGGWGCSASVIAPRVVLTAGHCVDGHSRWDVRVGKETRTSTSALTYDWKENGAQLVNPAHHDLGLGPVVHAAGKPLVKRSGPPCRPPR